jgi:glyoxylase-like metal-dependent hydrolase (beta-lactamase superfamily II)
VPVRYLVNTHWHFDHNDGAVAYRDAFEGLTYIAERDSKHYIEVNSDY